MRSLLTFLVTFWALRPRAYYRENKAISLLFHKSNPEEVHVEHLLSYNRRLVENPRLTTRSAPCPVLMEEQQSSLRSDNIQQRGPL
jgi:hypothetical protein